MNGTMCKCSSSSCFQWFIVECCFFAHLVAFHCSNVLLKRFWYITPIHDNQWNRPESIQSSSIQCNQRIITVHSSYRPCAHLSHILFSCFRWYCSTWTHSNSMIHPGKSAIELYESLRMLCFGVNVNSAKWKCSFSPIDWLVERVMFAPLVWLLRTRMTFKTEFEKAFRSVLARVHAVLFKLGHCFNSISREFCHFYFYKNFTIF